MSHENDVSFRPVAPAAPLVADVVSVAAASLICAWILARMAGGRFVCLSRLACDAAAVLLAFAPSGVAFFVIGVQVLPLSAE